MVPEGQPLVMTFTGVVKTTGHACPAVTGAYRSTQLALDPLYPDEYPLCSEIAVTVGGDPSDSGVGQMANVTRQIASTVHETGFAGFSGHGGREDLLSVGDVDAPGRVFRFKQTDTGGTVVVSFDPAAPASIRTQAMGCR